MYVCRYGSSAVRMFFFSFFFFFPMERLGGTVVNSCSRNPLAFSRSGVLAGGMSVLREVDKGDGFFFSVRDAVCDAGGEWCGDRMLRRFGAVLAGVGGVLVGGWWGGFNVGWVVV